MSPSSGCLMPNGASRSRPSSKSSKGVQPSDELAAELIAHCQERIGRYKCPRSVDFRDHLPRTDGGKLYKRLLRDEYWASAERRV